MLIKNKFVSINIFYTVGFILCHRILKNVAVIFPISSAQMKIVYAEGREIANLFETLFMSKMNLDNK